MVAELVSVLRIVPLKNLIAPSDDQPDQGEVCIANISTEERLKRLRFGVIEMVVALAVLAILMISGVSHWWRLPLFLLFAGAAVGYFQWRDKT